MENQKVLVALKVLVRAEDTSVGLVGYSSASTVMSIVMRLFIIVQAV